MWSTRGFSVPAKAEAHFSAFVVCGQIAVRSMIVIFILAGVVHGCAGIKASEPGVSRAVVEQAGIGAIVGQRAGKRGTPNKFTRKPNSFANRSRLKFKAR